MAKAADGDGDAGVPKYRKIAAKLREVLADPKRNPRDPLAPDRILAAQYEVAPTTVRKAIGLLRAEGLVDVRHGSGVYKRTWKPILRDATKRLSLKQWGDGKAIQDADVSGRKAEPVNPKISYQDAPDRVFQRLGVREVLVRERVYVVDKRPVMFAATYLPAEIARGTQIEQEDTGRGGIYARLKDLGLAPAHFTEIVRARTPTPDEQAKLRIGPDHPVAEITRIAKTAAGQVVEVNEMVLDGEAYVMQWSFTP